MGHKEKPADYLHWISRATILLSLSQILVVLLGFITLALVLKFYGYPGSPEFPLQLRCTRLTLFLREQGPLLFLTPVLWTPYALLSQHRDSGFFTFRLSCAIGVAISLVLLLLFLYASLFPGVRPILILQR